jgi:hypothetical protein
MLKNLVFYNWYGNGDLFNSREFIKELMERVEAENYIYRHPKHPNVFQDIPELGHGKIDDDCPNDKAFNHVDDSLYINTWIGRDGSYVLPGIGCTIQQNRRMYNDILEAAGMDVRLERSLEDYIPIVDWSKLTRQRKVYGFCDILLRYEHGSLWVTGNAQSAQSNNFSFWPAIEVITEEFPDHVFVVTDKPPDELYLNRKNVYFTGDILGTDDGFDLNDIAYLSTFMNTIIGRPTGPFTFAQVKDNMMESEMALLGFSYHPNVLCFAHSFKTPIEKFWSGDTDTETVIKHVRSVITR